MEEVYESEGMFGGLQNGNQIANNIELSHRECNSENCLKRIQFESKFYNQNKIMLYSSKNWLWCITVSELF